MTPAPGHEPPSGRQFELAWGDQRATVVEVGGGLRSYSAGGVPLLDGYSADERCTGARGQWLVPWPNRLRDGRYRFGGRQHQLPLTEPQKANAIHGLVRWSTWSVAHQAADRVVLEHLLHPQPGYPFTLSLEAEYSLGAGGLSAAIRARNVGTEALPVGAGVHPYLRLGTGPIDDLILRAPGATRMATDERQIPVGTEPVAGTDADFRSSRPISGAVLDTGYGDLERDGEGRAWVHLSTADRARAVSLWMSERFGYVMLFTGDTLEQPERRRSGLGVEPMTCPPNALATGDGVAVLRPGEAFSAAWGMVPRLDGAGGGDQGGGAPHDEKEEEP